MSTLYVVATPIGNLSDMSPRAVETLKNVGLIAAEDTRVTMKLTAHFDIHTPLVSCHQHNEKDKSQHIVDRMLRENIDAALVTDAGTPAISDPGTYLVKCAAENGIPVIAVAGPSAMAAAMSVSGFDLTEFAFCGFLPREKKELEEKLRDLGQRYPGAIVHESPYRIKELMAAVCRVLPDAMVSLSCDLTKLHELTIRGTPHEILANLEANEKAEKGEYCMVMDLRNVPVEAPKEASAASPEAQILECMLGGMELRQAREKLMEQGVKKNIAYAAAIRVKNWLEGDE